MTRSHIKFTLKLLKDRWKVTKLSSDFLAHDRQACALFAATNLELSVKRPEVPHKVLICGTSPCAALLLLVCPRRSPTSLNNRFFPNKKINARRPSDLLYHQNRIDLNSGRLHELLAGINDHLILIAWCNKGKSYKNYLLMVCPKESHELSVMLFSCEK